MSGFISETFLAFQAFGKQLTEYKSRIVELENKKTCHLIATNVGDIKFMLVNIPGGCILGLEGVHEAGKGFTCPVRIDEEVKLWASYKNRLFLVTESKQYVYAYLNDITQGHKILQISYIDVPKEAKKIIVTEDHVFLLHTDGTVSIVKRYLGKKFEDLTVSTGRVKEAKDLGYDEDSKMLIIVYDNYYSVYELTNDNWPLSTTGADIQSLITTTFGLFYLRHNRLYKYDIDKEVIISELDIKSIDNIDNDIILVTLTDGTTKQLQIKKTTVQTSSYATVPI